MGHGGELAAIVGFARLGCEDGADGYKAVSLEAELKVGGEGVDGAQACRYVLVGAERRVIGKDGAGGGREGAGLHHRGRVGLRQIARRVVDLEVGAEDYLVGNGEETLVLEAELHP